MNPPPRPHGRSPPAPRAPAGVRSGAAPAVLVRRSRPRSSAATHPPGMPARSPLSPAPSTLTGPSPPPPSLTSRLRPFDKVMHSSLETARHRVVGLTYSVLIAQGSARLESIRPGGRRGGLAHDRWSRHSDLNRGPAVYELRGPHQPRLCNVLHRPLARLSRGP